MSHKPKPTAPNYLGALVWTFPALLSIFGVIGAPFGGQTLGFALLAVISLRNIHSHLTTEA